MVVDAVVKYASMVKDRKAGMTYTALAEKHGISRQRVHQIVARELMRTEKRARKNGKRAS